MRVPNTVIKLWTAGIVLAASIAPSNAAILEVHTVACSTDVFQTCDTSNFLTAVGPGLLDVSLDLLADKNGNPLPSGVVSGTAFSDDVTFSSRFSPTFGIGLDSPNVQFGGVTAALTQVGAVDGGSGFRGILEIDFANPVSAVGFTTVSLETNGTIDLFDSANALISTIAGPSNAVLDYIGLVATGGDEISRIVLDGDLFAVRDIQFNFATLPPVALPETGTVALMTLGFAGLGFLRRRRT